MVVGSMSILCIESQVINPVKIVCNLIKMKEIKVIRINEIAKIKYFVYWRHQLRFALEADKSPITKSAFEVYPSLASNQPTGF